jgi:FtsH-binding integral membrane protein
MLSLFAPPALLSLACFCYAPLSTPLLIGSLPLWLRTFCTIAALIHAQIAPLRLNLFIMIFIIYSLSTGLRLSFSADSFSLPLCYYMPL